MSLLNEEQLKTLLSAAQSLGINPDQLKADNPWKFSGPRAAAIQEAIAQQNPAMAAQWRVDAGETLSLGAIAAREGISVMTNAQHAELLSLDADYAAGAQESQARREAEVLDAMEKAADKLSEARGRRQSQAARRARSPQLLNNSGQHAKEFIDRIGGLQNLNMPARKLIPGQ